MLGLELGGDRLLQLNGSGALGRDIADQGESEHAVAVERIFPREGWLPEDNDSDAVVRAKLVVGIEAGDRLTRTGAAHAARRVGRREVQACAAIGRRRLDDRRRVAVARGKDKQRYEQATAQQ